MLRVIGAKRTRRKAGPVKQQLAAVSSEAESLRRTAVHSHAVRLGEAQRTVAVDVDLLTARHGGVEGERVVAAHEAGHVAGVGAAVDAGDAWRAVGAAAAGELEVGPVGVDGGVLDVGAGA